MGDLANMTSAHGEVDGFRLLRWLRSRADIEHRHWCAFYLDRDVDNALRTSGYQRALTDLADDLERELTPLDSSEDNDEGADLDDTAMTDGP